MCFRLRMRKEEIWITMMNNSVRHSCETVFHVITWHTAEELSEVGGQCQHASASPDRTQLLRRPLHALYSPLQAEDLLTPSHSADFGIYHSHCQTPATPNNEAFPRSTNAFLTSQRPVVCTFTKKKKKKMADKAEAPEWCGESYAFEEEKRIWWKGSRNVGYVHLARMLRHFAKFRGTRSSISVNWSNCIPWTRGFVGVFTQARNVFWIQSTYSHQLLAKSQNTKVI